MTVTATLAPNLFQLGQTNTATKDVLYQETMFVSCPSIRLTFRPPASPPPARQFINRSANLITVGANGGTGYIGPVGTGQPPQTAKVEVKVPSEKFDQTISIPIAVYQDVEQVGYAPGSLGAAVTDDADARIARTGATTKLYTLTDDVNAKYVRDANSLLAGVDMTCIPACNVDAAAGNPYEAAYFLGCLIAPDATLTAAHPGTPSPGTQFRFVDLANGVHTVAVLSAAQVPGTDLLVIRHASPLPASITPAKLLPANYASFLPTNGYPLWWPDKYRNLWAARWQYPGGATVPTGDDPLAPFASPAVNDDSGAACGIVVNGQFVLVTQWYTSDLVSAMQGPSDADNAAGINAVLSQLGSPYSVGTVDLSGFTAFG